MSNDDMGGFEKYRVEIAGNRNYFCALGSDVDRDGMYFELAELSSDKQVMTTLMEVFYSDDTGMMTFTSFAKSIPLAAVEWLIENAKQKLPPIVKPTATI